MDDRGKTGTAASREALSEFPLRTPTKPLSVASRETANRQYAFKFTHVVVHGPESATRPTGAPSSVLSSWRRGLNAVLDGF